MKKRSERFSENSIWNFVSPTASTQGFPLYGLEAGHFYADSDYLVKRKFHNSFLLLYTLHGKGLIHYENTNFSLPAQTAFLIDCKRPHMYGSQDGDWEFLWIHFQGSFCDTAYKTLYPELPCTISVAESTFENDFFSLIQNLCFQDTLKAFEFSNTLQNMIFYLDRCLTLEGEKTPLKNQFILLRSVEYMENHYFEELSVSDLAAKENLSEYYFIRLFKTFIGVPPYSYLLMLRISNAKRLLIETDLSVDEIAHRCGFTDTANFIRKFKQSLDETPLQYRKSFK